jgi:hypothetical protein
MGQRAGALTGADELPEPFAGRLREVLVEGETVLWTARRNERLGAPAEIAWAHAGAPLVVLLIAAGGALYQGEWALASGAALLFSLAGGAALWQAREVYYVITPFRLLTLRWRGKAVLADGLLLGSIRAARMSASGMSVRIAYESEGRAASITLPNLHDPEGALPLLRKRGL